MNRRTFLVGLAATAGCDGVRGEAARRLGASVPETLDPATSRGVDPVHHLLNRAAFGPWPGDVERVRAMGIRAWIDEQLDPTTIADPACRIMARRFESVVAPAGESFEFEPEVVQEELTRHTVLRAVYSKRQLQEVMVAFWTDHFNISMAKGDCAHLRAADLREVVRAHALGRFRGLVRASALSSAMLVYLDGTENAAGVPNENYARELLELHTMGVHGGYTQQDVMEAARCLTGWVVRDAERWRKGSVDFVADRHDDGTKVVLGTSIEPAGEDELDALLDVILAHPSVPRFLADKLCRFFVADAPPPGLVQEVADTFAATDGAIAPTLRVLLTSEAFMASASGKVKRPFRFLVSALRGLGAITSAPPELVGWLARMGHAPFEHPTPDGYPFEARPWLSTLPWRWQLARTLTEHADVPFAALSRALGDGQGLFAHLVGRRPNGTELALLSDVEASTPLVLAAPAFQVH